MRPSVTLAVAVLSGCGGGFEYRAHPPEELAGHRGYSWVRDSTEHFQLYVAAGTPAAERIPELREEAEASLARVREVLGREPDTAEPIHVFQVSGTDDVVELVGLRSNGISNPETGVVVGIEVDGWSAATSPHEMMHVFMYRHFGAGSIGTTYGSLALAEGLCVFASGRWHGRDLRELARELLADGKGAPVHAMLSQGRAALNDSVLYPLAGSFVRFLHERYGPERLYDFYERQYASDTSEVEAAFGASEAELDAEWRRWLTGASRP